MNIIVRDNEVVAGTGLFECYREKDLTKLDEIIKATMFAKLAEIPKFLDDQIKLFIDLEELSLLLPDSEEIITYNTGDNLSEFLMKLNYQKKRGHDILYDKRIYIAASDSIFESDMAKAGLTGEYNRIRTHLEEVTGKYSNLIKTFKRVSQ